MSDDKYMRIAIELANKGIGKVNPNPLVGAVIVKNGKIIGQGYHERYGGPHAEITALKNCIESPSGGILYITLEPCSHRGKTPPCTEAISASGIRKVKIGAIDPNPLVVGKGIQLLRSVGIEVEQGILEKECREQNTIFFHYITKGTPYVTLKYAMTLDGKIATRAGDSKWITSKCAREMVHQDRNRYSGIMIGVGTVIADDPMLTCRVENGNNPIRIICDTHLSIPETSNILKTSKEIRTIIATACTDRTKQDEVRQWGCEVIVLPMKDKHIDIRVLMKELGAMGIDSIIIEGGSTLNYSALQNEIVNKIQAYISPKIFGGDLAKTAVGGRGCDSIDDCIKLGKQRVFHLGEDILIECEVVYDCLQE